MKLTVFFLTAGLLNVCAKGMSQNVSFSGKSVSLEVVFTSVQKQTGFLFLYSESVLQSSKPISINAVNVDLKDFLFEVFKSQPLEFDIKGKSIIVTLKEVPHALSITNVFKINPIRGKVLDEDGQPLSGASITVKNTQNSGVTNDEGVFSINVNVGDILVVTYVAHQSKEVKISSQNISSGLLIITLSKNTSQLSDVEVSVNTGYQRIPKSQMTGAATAVNSAVYHQRQAITGNFLESLEGKVPGLVYNGQTGELSIRGVSTFDAVKQPLIVLDGFPTEIDLRTINPNDIVSVSVLRDAAAASIYGVRASNGVIIVETRRGKAGKAVLQFNATYGLQPAPDLGYLNYMKADEYVQLQREYFYIANPSDLLFQLGFAKMNPAEKILFQGPRPGVLNPVLDQKQVDEQLAALGSYNNLDEYEQLFYRTREVKNVHVDVSGGTTSNTYIFGVNFIDETPVNRNFQNRQLNVSLANTFRFSNRFNLNLKGTYTHNNNLTTITPSYVEFFPYEHLADESGNPLPVALAPNRDYLINAISDAVNESNMAAGLYDLRYYPYRELSANNSEAKGTAIRFQGLFNGKITNWLNLDLGGNYEQQTILTNELQREEAYAVSRLISSMALKDPLTGKAVYSNMPQGDILRRTNARLINYTLRGQLNIDRRFSGGIHSVSGILGVEQKKSTNNAYTTTFFGYDGQSLIAKPINMGALNGVVVPAFQIGGAVNAASFKSTDYFGETYADRRFMSYYGQATYIYRAKYVATGSFRIDQSNLFGVEPKYRNKPLWSAGLSWRLGQEDFIKQYQWINQLQIRIATGFNGNVPNSNNGPFLLLATGLNTTLHTPLVYTDVLTPENQSLRWETTQNHNLGVDFGLMGNRISGSVDYYIKKTTDVYGQFDSDPTTGFNLYNANTASIRNQGLEFLISTVNFRNTKIAWRSQVTASFNNNKVLAVKATEFANSSLVASATTPTVGLPLGSIYSYRYGGLNNLGQPFVIDRYGENKILSLSGSAVVDVTKEDLVYSGTTTPKYTLGLNNQFSIGNFDVSFLIMYYGGHVMRVEQPNPNTHDDLGTLPLQGSAGFWRKPGDEKHTIIPGFSPTTVSAPGYYPFAALYGYQYGAQFVRKADYLRLRDLIITYNLRMPWLTRAGIQHTQLRLQAQNAYRYTFSGNDVDPEALNRISGVRKLQSQPLYSLTFSTNF